MTESVDGQLFRRVTTTRVSRDVVVQLRDAIEAGVLSAGDRLPPERELASQLAVSRATVRDALRILEAQGLIEIRVGAGGGAFVTAPHPEHARESLSNLVMMSAATAQEITAAREVVELGLLELACEHADSGDIDALNAICDRAEREQRSGVFDPRRSTEFHLRLAQCTHNLAIELLVSSLQDPTRRSLEQAQLADPAMGEEGLREHRELTNAVSDRDAERARSILRSHLQRTAVRLRPH